MFVAVAFVISILSNAIIWMPSPWPSSMILFSFFWTIFWCSGNDVWAQFFSWTFQIETKSIQSTMERWQQIRQRCKCRICNECRHVYVVIFCLLSLFILWVAANFYSWIDIDNNQPDRFWLHLCLTILSSFAFIDHRTIQIRGKITHLKWMQLQCEFIVYKMRNVREANEKQTQNRQCNDNLSVCFSVVLSRMLLVGHAFFISFHLLPT